MITMTLALAAPLALLGLLASDQPMFFDAVLTPDGKVVLAALSWESNSQVVYFAAADGEFLRLRPIPAGIRAIAVGPKGEGLAVLCEDREVMVASVEGDDEWRTLTLKRSAVPQEGQRYQSTLEFSPKGDRIVAALPGYKVALISSEGALVKDWDAPAGPLFTRAHFWAYHGDTLVIARENALELREAATGGIEKVMEFENAVTALDLQPGTALAAVGHTDGICELIDLASEDVQAEIEHRDPTYGLPPYSQPDPMFEEPFPRFAELAFSPDGRWLAYTTSPRVYLGLIEMASAKVASLGPSQGGASGSPAFLGWSGDSETVWSFNSFSNDAFLAKLTDDAQEGTAFHHGPAPGPYRFYRHRSGETAAFTSPARQGPGGMLEVGVLSHATGLPLWRVEPLKALLASIK